MTYHPLPETLPTPSARPRPRPGRSTCETANLGPDLSLRPMPRVSRSVARTEGTANAADAADVVIRGRRCGLDLEEAGVHPLPEPMVVTTVGRERWLLAEASHDPIVAKRGTLPMPAAMRGGLRRLHEEGIDFSTIVVAHQLPDPQNATAAAPADLLRGPRHAVSAADGAALVPDPTPHPKSARSAERLGQLSTGVGQLLVWGGAAAAGLALAPIAGAAWVASLDPMILAAMTLKPGEPTAGDPAVWFMLGRWDW